jgi:thymidine phosphorylase
MAKTTYPVIPDEALIDIKVSGTFYKKLLKLSVSLGESRPIEDYKRALETLGKELPKDLYELNVQVVVAMLYEVEKAARDQKKTKMIEVDLETGATSEPTGS